MTADQMREELRGKLPGWIGKSLEVVDEGGVGGGGVGGGMKWRKTRERLEGFFEGKRGAVDRGA